MAFKVSHDYAVAASPPNGAAGVMGYATAPEQERLMTVLPSLDDLRGMFTKSIRAHSRNVELMEMKRPASRRLWLTSDPDGPGYMQQKTYGFLWIEHDDYLMLDDPKVADRLRAEAVRCVDELAKDVAERVSTFRAYNHLTANNCVTIRGLRNTSPGYLMKRGADTYVRVSETTDQFFVILGSYFFVAPPGDEWMTIEGAAP